MQLLLAPERADLCSSSSPLNALICAQVSPRTTFLPKYTSPIFAEVLEPYFWRSTCALILAEYLCPNSAGVLEPYFWRSTGALFLPEYWSPIFAKVLCRTIVPAYGPSNLPSTPSKCSVRPKGAVALRAKPSGEAPAFHSDGQIEVYCHLTRIFWKQGSCPTPFFRACCEKKIFFWSTALPSILTSIVTSTVTSI